MTDPIFVAGHRGLVGSAILRALELRGGGRILVRTRNELDLRDQSAVKRFFADERPATVFLAAAKVGGIIANDRLRWDFLLENLQIETNVLAASLDTGVDRVVFLGSSCVYPRLSPQPIREEYLLTGPLEPTNEPYAIAKIAGLKLVEAANAQYGRQWLSLMPTNLYGPRDNFDLTTSHVLPAMIRKFHEAVQSRARGEDVGVTLWGTGSVRREFLHVDDLAQAAVKMSTSSATGLLNVGVGDDVTIRELAAIVADSVGYSGPIEWDTSKPDGTPRKLLDSSRIRAAGWSPKIGLREGIGNTYRWYLEHVEAGASYTPVAPLSK